jgi:hypothetical protein
MLLWLAVAGFFASELSRAAQNSGAQGQCSLIVAAQHVT